MFQPLYTAVVKVKNDFHNLFQVFFFKNCSVKIKRDRVKRLKVKTPTFVNKTTESGG